MARGGKLSFRPAAQASPSAALPPWPVLVVDDDEQVHEMTRVLLRDFQFEDRDFHMVSAYSAQQARQLLSDTPDFPVVLLDVVMESPDAGLALVQTIRQDLGNQSIRIVLRTGQPGEAPERDVILAYDINDYKSKAELTAQKLFTALVAAIRNWRDINTIGRLNADLTAMITTLEDKVAARTKDLQDHRDALLVAKDRTEKALEREIEAKRQLQQFLSMVSHEFRTPLAVIDSAAQMMRLKSDPSDTTLRGRIDTIRGAVQRLIGLIETCLADDQLEQGRILLHEEMVDLLPLVQSLVDQQSNAVLGRDVQLLCPSDPPPIWADPKLLSLAVGNLIANGLKYSEHGPVVVLVETQADRIAVSVTDQGIGIPQDEQAKVFTRFYRAGNAAGISGTGIGLHMVRQIVDLHDGQISLTSQVGQGTTVTIWLYPDHRNPGGYA